MDFRKEIQEGLDKGIANPVPPINIKLWGISGDNNATLVPRVVSGLSHEEAIQKINIPLFDNAQTEDDITKMRDFIVKEIAYQMDPNVDVENTVAAWYRKAKSLRGITLPNIYAYLEAEPEFFIALMGKVRDYNPTLTDRVIHLFLHPEHRAYEGKEKIAFFEQGFCFYSGNSMRDYTQKIFFYDRWLLSVAIVSEMYMGIDFDFSGNKYSADEKTSEEIVDMYFSFMEEMHFTQNFAGSLWSAYMKKNNKIVIEGVV